MAAMNWRSVPSSGRSSSTKSNCANSCDFIDASAGVVRVAPVPLSVVCFRADADDAFNERLLEAVSAGGEVFLSHTRLQNRFTLRLAIGNLRTTEAHVARAWTILQETALQLRTPVEQ